MDMDIMTTIKDNWALHPKPIREKQEHILSEILDGIEKGYKYFIVHAGTGIGKSAISTTLTQIFHSCDRKSYILTPNIQLQTQYTNEFPTKIKDIKGKKHYKCKNGGDCSKCYCNLKVNKYNNIAEKRRILGLNPKWQWFGNISKEKYDEILSEINVHCHDCEYAMAKKDAIGYHTMLTNYHYLYSLGNYAHQIHPRDLLICDEAHNLENIISSMLTKTINRTTILENYHFDIFYDINFINYMELETTQYWQKIFDRIIHIIKKEKQRQKELLKELELPNDFIEKELEEYDTEINEYKNFSRLIAEKNNFIINLPTLDEINMDRDIDHGLKVTLEPVMISNYANNLLRYGDIVVFLSATLPSKSKYCEYLGLDSNEVKLIRAASPFPKTNRPIVLKEVRENNFYKWKHESNIKAIKEIVNDHAGEKGVIHTTSNEQSWWIHENLKDTIKCFVIAPEKGIEYNRTHLIDSFKKYNGPALCIGAGIKEGVDFEGDKCRFQIMLNVPYLRPTDKLKKRQKIDPTWPYFNLVIKLEQAYGRGVRNENDRCVFYMLDKRIKTVLNKNKQLLSRYFRQGVYVGRQFDVEEWMSDGY